MKSLFLSSAALIAFAAPAFAQANFNLGTNADENVVVSATRLPTPEAEVGSSVTVITAADIDARQERSLPDALETVPGLFVEQSGGLGGQTADHRQNQVDDRDNNANDDRPVRPLLGTIGGGLGGIVLTLRP